MSKKYWLSLDDLLKKKTSSSKNSSEFMHPLPSIKELQEGTSRREFLKLMAASMALGATACFRRPTEKIVPFVNRPEDIIPGEENYYSSSYYDGEEGLALVVKTKDGRPVKIEGNPQADELNGNGLSPQAASYILSLYDPERLKNPQKNLFNEKKTNRESINQTYTSMDARLVEEFKKGGVAILSPRIPSPSFQRLLQDFRHVYKAKHYVWDPCSHEQAVEAQKLSFGTTALPSYRFSKARLILSLNCDFLGTHLAPTSFQKEFSKYRHASSKMNRLIVVESLMSLTGSNADTRFRIQPDQELAFFSYLLQTLEDKGMRLPQQVKRIILGPSYKKTDLPLSNEAWHDLADSLIKHKGESLILYGSTLRRSAQTLNLHILTSFLNQKLGNVGQTLDYSRPFAWDYGSYDQIKQLQKDIENSQVKTLIIHGVNPVYSYPEPEFLQALKQATTVIYTGDRIDETGFYSDYIVPDSHSLEKWQDWEFKKQVFSIGQPCISPLYKTRAFEDSLLTWIQASGNMLPDRLRVKSFYHYIKEYWVNKKGLGFWDNFLREGIYKQDSNMPQLQFRDSALLKIKKDTSITTNYKLLLYQSSGLKQGNLSNVPWLMEFPDPVTKICWDNYLCISLKTAEQFKLKEGQIVELAYLSKKLRVPVHIQPGQSENTLGLAVGFGRWRAGTVGNKVGVNAYNLNSDVEVSFKATDDFIPLANVQGHHSMEGRDIVLETRLSEFLKDPHSGMPKHHKAKSIWSHHEYKGHKWGMVIDLNSCNGCGTCMLACQSENNIPTVGKNMVLEGREMHWIRVDRYYQGEAENPSAVHQPVVCMHCDNAPCETVCPVMATVHSSEGTNDMIYNRCVGTRYCSNNCPYKVRRFNWFNYTKNIKEPVNMVLNPDVTVRSRGVMEKCSFCIQRIHQGKDKAKKQDRKLKDGEIKTACEQACPAQAITFGDLNDPVSKVRKEFDKENSYGLLDDMLNTKPAVKYQTKVRNT